MKTTVKVKRKIQAARKLIESCISPNGMGIYASRGRYEYQCWTRDFALAAAPALRLIGRSDVVEQHLDQLMERQRSDGRIPILYLTNEKAFLRAKVKRSIDAGKMSFMLERFLEPGGVEELSPWTKDSEFLAALAVLEHSPQASTLWSSQMMSRVVNPAMDYVEANLMGDDSLVRGADWRDTNTWLANRALLSNNCLLLHVYGMCGTRDEVRGLQEAIEKNFWTGTGYRDYVGVDSADAFGQALGVIYDAIPEGRYPAILESFAKLHTPRGYMTNDCRPNPTTPAERRLLKSMKQSFVIWPFIHGFVILALIKMGEMKLAEQAFREYTAMSGFWEYYDPKTGKGYGAKEQLWSAALYLRAAHALGHDVMI